jgi:hypothetical protein
MELRICVYAADGPPFRIKDWPNSLKTFVYGTLVSSSITGKGRIRITTPLINTNRTKILGYRILRSKLESLFRRQIFLSGAGTSDSKVIDKDPDQDPDPGCRLKKNRKTFLERMNP